MPIVQTHTHTHYARCSPAIYRQEEDYGPPHPEDGGYDVAWPTAWAPRSSQPLHSALAKAPNRETFGAVSKGPDEHEEFSAAVAETVNDKGFLGLTAVEGFRTIRSTQRAEDQGLPLASLEIEERCGPPAKPADV